MAWTGHFSPFAATECHPCNKLSARLLCFCAFRLQSEVDRFGQGVFQFNGPTCVRVCVCVCVSVGLLLLPFGCMSVFCLLLPAIPAQSLWAGSSIKFTPMSKILLQNLDPVVVVVWWFLVVSPFARRSLFISQFVFNFCVTFLSIFVVLHTSNCQSLWWVVVGWLLVCGGFTLFYLPAVFRVNCVPE